MKLVNIYPQYPITSVNPPIRTMVRRVHMPASNIRLCLLARATVEEILPDGSIIRLSLANYDTDNAPAKAAPVVRKNDDVDLIKANAITDPVILNAPRDNTGKVDTSGMTKKQRRDYYRAKREAEAKAKAEQASQVQPDKKEPVVETASKEKTAEDTLDEKNFEVVDIETLGLH